MKYSEFEKKVSAMGYYAEQSERYINIRNSQGDYLAYVSRLISYSMGTVECTFKHLDAIAMRNIIDVCYNLASTPLEEREDEKKFRLKMEGLSVNNSFVNLCTQEYGEEKYTIDDMFEGGRYQTIFTEKDILKMPENIQKAIELGIITKVEVTER